MSYRRIFENSKDGNCPLCGSQAEEHRNNPGLLNGWFCSNKNCEYSFDNFLAKMNKINSDGDTSSSDDSYEVLIVKKELKFILIGSIIGAVAGVLVYGLLIGGFNDILYILVGIWAGIGWGGSINLVPSFFRAGRTISESNAGVIGVVVVILWFILSTFSGIIWPLIRILIKVFKIKKLQRNG